MRTATHIELVVDLDHGGIDAGAEAFNLSECEKAVGRGLSSFDSYGQIMTLDASHARILRTNRDSS